MASTLTPRKSTYVSGGSPRPLQNQAYRLLDSVLEKGVTCLIRPDQRTPAKSVAVPAIAPAPQVKFMTLEKKDSDKVWTYELLYF